MQGYVLENEKAKLIWGFEFNLQKVTTSQRQDFLIKDKKKKKAWVCDMTSLEQVNIEE